MSRLGPGRLENLLKEMTSMRDERDEGVMISYSPDSPIRVRNPGESLSLLAVPLEITFAGQDTWR